MDGCVVGIWTTKSPEPFQVRAMRKVGEDLATI